MESSLSIHQSVAIRLLPCHGYCEQGCREHWGACVYSDEGFLQICDQGVQNNLKPFVLSYCSPRYLMLWWKKMHVGP